MFTPLYAERTPNESLRPWFLRVWGYRVGEDGELLAPPDGCTSLMVMVHPDLPGHLHTSGPWFKPPRLPVAPGTQVWGIRIQPHAAREVLSTEPEQLHDQLHSADRFLGAMAHRMAADIHAAVTIDDVMAALERHFARVVPRLPLPDQMSAEAIRRINQHEGVVELDQLAQEMDLVPRTIVNRFTKATGMHPRDFAMVRRAFYTCTGTLLGRTTWLSQLAERGETDHLDLVQEFLELTGRSPAEFVMLARGTTQDILRV